LPICRELRALFPGATLRGFDAHVSSEAAQDFFGFPTVPTLPEAFAGANIVLLLNNHAVFQQADLSFLAGSMNRPGIVYDLWNMHDNMSEQMPDGIVGLALGNERLKDTKA
jgi:UDP-N-acetyl-D-mannosaminuronic acid dehydrogenase